jgi:hypothetical protein
MTAATVPPAIKHTTPAVPATSPMIAHRSGSRPGGVSPGLTPMCLPGRCGRTLGIAFFFL